MATTKYHGRATVLLYADAPDVAPDIDLSGSSRTIEIQQSGNQIDVSTRDDFMADSTAYLAAAPERTLNLQGLDTTPDSSREWNDITVGDIGRVAVYPEGMTGSGKPYEIGNVVCTNKNYNSPHDNAATYQVQWRVTGTWTSGVTA